MKTSTHPDHWVASGPVKGTDWCQLPNIDHRLLAPGGVVLCVEGTTTLHPDAEQAAQSAWELLARWLGKCVGART